MKLSDRCGYCSWIETGDEELFLLSRRGLSSLGWKRLAPEDLPDCESRTDKHEDVIGEAERPGEKFGDDVKGRSAIEQRADSNGNRSSYLLSSAHGMSVPRGYRKVRP